MRKLFLQAVKVILVSLISVFLVTIGIDAADHYNNFSDSIVGRILYKKPAGPCPPDMVYVLEVKGGFCIDKYEASPGSKCPYLKTGGQENTRSNLDSPDCQPVSVIGNIPWNNISQTQAAAACAKAGKRLPTDAEWYLASLNTPDKTSSWTADDCQVKSNWASQPGLTGSGKNCVTSWGAFDMIGNVWEWVNGEIIDGKLNDQSMPTSGYITSIDINGRPIAIDENKPNPNFNSDYFWIKDKGIRGMARGGYWDNGSDAGINSMYLVSPPDYAGDGIGFRCVK